MPILRWNFEMLSIQSYAYNFKTLKNASWKFCDVTFLSQMSDRLLLYETDSINKNSGNFLNKPFYKVKAINKIEHTVTFWYSSQSVIHCNTMHQKIHLKDLRFFEKLIKHFEFFIEIVLIFRKTCPYMMNNEVHGMCK